MISLKSTTAVLLVLASLFYLNEQKSKTEKENDENNTVLVASTPGDSLIKSILGINPGTGVDFIRWNLKLGSGENHNNYFKLNINYGLSKPNTMGFTNDSVNATLTGSYTISKYKVSNVTSEIYQLHFNKTSTALSIIKLNDNLFHILTPDNNFMVGNGGWSYSLNRDKPVQNTSHNLVSFSPPSSTPAYSGEYVVFEGRTPCNEISRDYGLNTKEDCFKVKWKLTLYGDKNTLQPTLYKLKRTNSRLTDIEGKWAIINNIAGSSSLTIYQLDPDKPENSLSLLAGDNNVLFFLDKFKNYYVGNKDFSYTLNRKFE